MKPSNDSFTEAYEQLFSPLWMQFNDNNPDFNMIYQHFNRDGQPPTNDHIALRTLNNCSINLECITRWLLKLGFYINGEYQFETKKLRAKSFIYKDKNNHVNPDVPLIFVSELLTHKLSNTCQKILSPIAAMIKADSIAQLKDGCGWPNIGFNEFEILSKESEYAAWFATNGFCANHFTLAVHELMPKIDLETVNSQVKALGFELNTAGGEIKGVAEKGLRQSSILAHQSNYEFSDGITKKIPRGYVEFAQRYELNGRLFDGFEQANADKIFESTDKN
jgi:hypothetical protein